MSVTIATHNGTRVSREHNIRNRNITDKEKHIDRNGVHETWHDEKIRAAYQRIFGEAVKEYNKKQKREERKIDNYYRAVCKDATKNPAYEIIVGVYGSDCTTEMKKEILKEYFDTWKARNPNLELVGAYYHFDEQGKDPHLHIDYIPVAHGYIKGLSTQVGLNRALYEQDGFKTDHSHDTAQIKWQRKENEYLESLCSNRGLEVKHPMKEEAAHLETDVYKAKKTLEEITNQVAEIEKNIAPLRAEYYTRKEYVKEMSKDFNLINGVKENKSITGKIKSYEVPKDVWETQRVTRMDRDAHERAQERLEKMLADYSQVLKDNAQLMAASEDLIKSNKRMAKEIDKVNEALRNMPQNARNEFWAHFTAQQVQEPAQEEKPVKTQNKGFDDGFEDLER